MTTTSIPIYAPLSPRQCAVAHLVAQGMTNREIADRLFTSEATVRNHLYMTAIKLGLPSGGSRRVHIARWIWEQQKTAAEGDKAARG